MSKDLSIKLPRTDRLRCCRRISVKFDRKKSGEIGTRIHCLATLHEPYHHNLSINNTLAGVAQLVERVALMTAKRSTSRSWVRAPPSAIPIQSSSEQLFFLFFRWSMNIDEGRIDPASVFSTCVEAMLNRAQQPHFDS